MVLKRYSRPVEVVVYAQETPFVQLRATLRKRGLQPLPSLPGRDDGPAVFREVLPEEVVTEPLAPSSDSAEVAHEDMDLAGLGLDELGLGDLDDDDDGEATPASPSPNFPGLAGAPPPPGLAGAASPAAPRFSLPSSKAAAPSFSAPTQPVTEDDPPTAQIRADKVGALIEKSRQDDASPPPQQMTSRASTQTEMVDLSPWGYSLQVMFLGNNNETPAGDVLRGLQTHLGPWLQSVVDDPLRLAQDPNYSREIEQKIIEHLSDVMGAYPAVSADLHYLMG